MGYTASDLLGVGIGFLLSALFLFAPGYTFGWLSNLLEFRRRRLATRLAAAVPLSIGLTPIAAYFLWRWWLPLVWIVFGTCGAVCAILLVGDARANRLALSRPGKLVLAIAAGWLVVGTLSLIDVQIGNRLYFPVSSFDYSTRTAFTAALSRDRIPPQNPFFYAGQPAPLRYHYFWLIPGSLVKLLGGSLVSARMSMIAGTLWCGLGLLGLVALYLRLFQGRGGDRIERRTLIAVALLGVAGLGMLPTFIWAGFGRIVLPGTEWWDPRNQIPAWISAVLWVPHDLSALVAGLTGFLLAWDTASRRGLRLTIVGTVAGALAFASSAGASVYVGITIAAGCALWLVIALLKGRRRHAWILAGAGMLAGALLVPFLLEVTRGLEGASYSAPFSFTVRGFVLVPPGNTGKTLALEAAALPLNYFLEFGFFFVVGWLSVRRIWRRGFRGEAEWCAAALGAASLFVCTFTKSGVLSYNDLGWRSPLLLQFVLLLWAAEMWDEGEIGFGPARAGGLAVGRRAAPYLVAATIVLGIMGSCYDLCLQRVFPILSDAFAINKIAALPFGPGLGRQTLALRSAYEELNRTLPARAIVQHDPEGGIGSMPAALYSDRQTVADSGDCGTVFGGSKEFCDEVILPRLKTLFDDQPPATAAEAADTCREFSISALLFTDTDPVWRDKTSWIWRARPLVSNDIVRVIPCSGTGAELHGDAKP